MLIFHVTTAEDWRAAQQVGRCTTSTRGRTLAEVGFVHASRADQWQEVRRRVYGDTTEPLVLLVIETDLLDAPVVEEPAPGGAETFPHVYGAVPTSAVVAVHELDPPGPADPADPAPLAPSAHPGADPGVSFSRIFLEELFHRVRVAAVLVVAIAAGGAAGLATGPAGAAPGALVGLLVGVPLAVLLDRRRAPR